MAAKEELLEITNPMIKKLSSDINQLQDKALRLSAAGELEKLRAVLEQQQQAIGAQIAMVDAAQLLSSR